MFLVFFIGSLYVFIGCISLFTALLFIELERPRDLIQSGLLILLGTFLLIYKNVFNLKVSLILSLNALLICSYITENFSYRWNQLLEKEKFDIKSLSGFKRNFSIIYRIIRLDLKDIFLNNKIGNIFKNTSIKKKWVRPDENSGTPSLVKAPAKESIKNIQKADFSREDIINDEKNNTKNTKSD